MKIVLSALVVFLTAMTCPQLEAGSIYPDCEAGTLQSYISSSGCILGEVGDTLSRPAADGRWVSRLGQLADAKNFPHVHAAFGPVGAGGVPEAVELL